jgi:cytochrome b involved in lipid metabolism
MHAARAAAIEASAGPDEKVKDEPVAVKPGVPSTVFTLADLEKHDSETDCWIAVNGVVYDTNPYLTEHPGGAQSITMNAGQEVTEEFTAIHSRKAWALLDKYAIGTLKTDGASVKTVEASDSLVALNMLEKTMPPPGPDTYIFCCGPPPMIKSAIAKLEALGHDPSHVLCF